MARADAWNSGGGERSTGRRRRAGDPLGGHYVQGHVDAVGAVLSRTPEGQGARLRIALPAAIAPLVAEKGSIAVDGVSLTVAAVGRDWFEVTLAPRTDGVVNYAARLRWRGLLAGIAREDDFDFSRLDRRVLILGFDFDLNP